MIQPKITRVLKNIKSEVLLIPLKQNVIVVQRSAKNTDGNMKVMVISGEKILGFITAKYY